LSRTTRAATNKPNILFIAIDDLNDWIACLGGYAGKIHSPNLDRLASRGVLFTNAHCAAPLCNPSRTALMTGVRPSTSGVYLNSQPFRQSAVLKDAVTLPMHLRAHGYTAIGSGKIYHGAFPDPQSWDDYSPSQKRTTPPGAGPDPAALPLNGIPRTAQFDWGPINASDEDMSDGKVAAWASQQLGKRHGKPLFLACGIFRPHLPWYVPKKYFDMYPLDEIVLPKVKEDDLNDVPTIGKKFARPDGDHRRVIEFGQWKKAVQSYLASITFADAMVGKVLRALETGPMSTDTMLVLWSDHGWHLGEKLHWRKFTLWEEATRNVLMMTAPGITKPGGRCARPSSLLDVYPTICDVAGVPKPHSLEGTSLMTLLRDPSARRDEPAVTTYFRGNHSVRNEHWRYTRYSDGAEELFDHRQDPYEWTNLAPRAEHAAVKAAMVKWLPKFDEPDSPIVRGRGEEPAG
jgi:arylsulfatase A-like enzyme